MIDKEQQYYLKESLKTIKNLCDTSTLLIEWERFELLATQLEVMFQVCQEILDEHCVEREDGHLSDHLPVGDKEDS